MKQSFSNRYSEIYSRFGFIREQDDSEEVSRFAGYSRAHGENLKILDLGCAEGMLSVALAKLGHRITAADINPDYLQIARANASDTGVAIQTLLLDIEKELDPGLEEYDLIYLMDVIEHVRSPIACLENVRAMLKDDGALIVNTPNAITPTAFWCHVRHRKRLNDYFRPENLGDLHLSSFDYDALEKLANFAGLKVTQVFPNRVLLPFIHRFSVVNPLFRALSKVFPLLSADLTVEMKKVEPIDVERQMAYWKQMIVE